MKFSDDWIRTLVLCDASDHLVNCVTTSAPLYDFN